MLRWLNKFIQNTKKRLNFSLRSKGKLSQLNNQIFNNLGLDSKGTIRLTSLEIYNSFFNITAENNEFELHKNLFDDFSFTELKQEVEEKSKSLILQLLQTKIYKAQWDRILLKHTKPSIRKEAVWWLLHVINGICSITISRFWIFLGIVVWIIVVWIKMILK